MKLDNPFVELISTNSRNKYKNLGPIQPGSGPVLKFLDPIQPGLKLEPILQNWIEYLVLLRPIKYYYMEHGHNFFGIYLRIFKELQSRSLRVHLANGSFVLGSNTDRVSFGSSCTPVSYTHLTLPTNREV